MSLHMKIQVFETKLLNGLCPVFEMVSLKMYVFSKRQVYL